MNFIKSSLIESQETLDGFLENSLNIQSIGKAINMLVSCYENEGAVYSCGNGGSSCDAAHFAEELTGRFRDDRDPLPAVSISDSGHLTCIANDYGFEAVFSRFVQAFGKKNDILLAISTSGNSENVIKAVEVAKLKKVKSIALLGKNGGKLKGLVDLPIIVSSSKTERIQEVHIKIIHILIEGIERELFPHLYSRSVN